MRWYPLVLGVLAVWRVTHLLHYEDGPWSIVFKLRALAGTGVVGQAFNCFYCQSLWVSAPFGLALGDTAFDRLLLWLALSAGAIVLERTTAETLSLPPAPAIEQREDADVLR